MLLFTVHCSLFTAYSLLTLYLYYVEREPGPTVTLLFRSIQYPHGTRSHNRKGDQATVLPSGGGVSRMFITQDSLRSSSGF